jgi:hypothetical protein
MRSVLIRTNQVLQSSERSHQKNGTKSTCAVTFRSEAIRQAVASATLLISAEASKLWNNEPHEKDAIE